MYLTFTLKYLNISRWYWDICICPYLSRYYILHICKFWYINYTPIRQIQNKTLIIHSISHLNNLQICLFSCLVHVPWNEFWLFSFLQFTQSISKPGNSIIKNEIFQTPLAKFTKLSLVQVTIITCLHNCNCFSTGLSTSVPICPCLFLTVGIWWDITHLAAPLSKASNIFAVHLK